MTVYLVIGRWFRSLAMALLFSALGANTFAQGAGSSFQDCPPAEGLPHSTRICVQLGIANGKLVASDANPAATWTFGIAREKVFDEMGRLLARIPLQCLGETQTCVVHATEPEQQMQLSAQEQLACIERAGAGRSGWADFWTKISQASEIGGCDVNSDRIEGSRDVLVNLGADSPFSRGNGGLLPMNTESGILQFEVFMLPADVSIKVSGIVEPKLREGALRKIIEPLSGTLWNAPMIEARIQRYYHLLGVDPVAIHPSPQTPAIWVFEGRRLVLATLPDVDGMSAAKARELRKKAAWLMLSKSDFDTWRKNDKGTEPSIDFKANLSYLEFSEPILLTNQVADMKAGAAAAGITLVDAASQRRSNWTIADRTVNESTVFLVAASTDDSLPSTVSPTQNTRFIGVELSHQSGQGNSVKGVFKHALVSTPLGQFSANVKAGRDSANANTMSVDVLADYIAFDQLDLRVSAALGAVSEGEANRFRGGSFRTEARKGMRGRMELQPWRDNDGQILRLFTQFEQLTVTSKSQFSTDIGQDLNTVGVGALWRTSNRSSLQPWTLTLQPILLRGSVPGGANYSKARLGADFRARVAGLIFDASGMAEVASASTPLTELPSLGGGDSVRGFQRDDGVGRRYWKLQSEVWLPWPGGTSGEGGLAAALKDVWLAAFVDAGGVRLTAPGSAAGTRTGMGFGLRYLAGSMVVKLDYARGHGPADTGPARSRFYFGFSTDIPL